MLSAGPISHNSIHLLIITTDLAHFTDLLDMSFSSLLHFLPVLSLETSACSVLKIMSIRLFFLFCLSSRFS